MSDKAMMTASDEEARHQARMVRKKALMDAKIAVADREQGVLLVLTGNGKGKSSSAFGMAARALGHGMRGGVVQFLKGRQGTREEMLFRRFSDAATQLLGDGPPPCSPIPVSSWCCWTN